VQLPWSELHRRTKSGRSHIAAAPRQNCGWPASGMSDIKLYRDPGAPLGDFWVHKFEQEAAKQWERFYRCVCVRPPVLGLLPDS
jgi:hypothetical protein